jgi:hypothetical protein
MMTVLQGLLVASYRRSSLPVMRQRARKSLSSEDTD